MARRKRNIRHPATATAFEWDDANEAKLAARSIRPQDVEAVFLNEPRYERNKRSGTATWMMVGRDEGGRTLKIGILWADEANRVLRAITGRVNR